jgi:hypothetical protein
MTRKIRRALFKLQAQAIGRGKNVEARILSMDDWPDARESDRNLQVDDAPIRIKRCVLNGNRIRKDRERWFPDIRGVSRVHYVVAAGRSGDEVDQAWRCTDSLPRHILRQREIESAHRPLPSTALTLPAFAAPMDPLVSYRSCSRDTAVRGGGVSRTRTRLYSFVRTEQSRSTFL